MNPKEFKKILKEAVREVFQEEIKGILIEALKGNKDTILENKKPYSIVEKDSIEPKINHVRDDLRKRILGGENSFTTDIIPHQHSGYNPPPTNTAGEGSVLPPGEVSLDQIMNMFNK